MSALGRKQTVVDWGNRDYLREETTLTYWRGLRALGIRAAAALLVLVLPAVSYGEDELAVREAIGREAAAHFRAGRFAELDAQAAEFRASKARTPSGLWKLTNF